MTIQRLLETFGPISGAIASDSDVAALTAADIDALRTQSFEAGYASGWEDAASAEVEARKRIDAEFERNIQNLAFTYNEAIDRVRGELKNFVTALVEKFFPEIVPELLREHIRNELVNTASEIVDVPLEVVAAPDCAGLLEEMLQSDFLMDIDLVADPNLAKSQVFVRIASREAEIDLDPLLGALRNQLNAMQLEGAEGVVNDGG